MFGYDTVDTLDLFPDEHPAIIADLNTPFPTELWNRYELVFDSGTAEHCFNVKEVLGNAVRALKVGGCVMHILPMSGFAGHGFYQFSPDLFAAFYGKNGFEEIEIKIELRIGLKAYFFDYDPNRPLPGDFWGIPAQIFFTARKVREVDKILIPNQSVFELPLDHPLRIAGKNTPSILLAKKLLPDVLKKYFLRKKFFAGIKLHPL
jgi:SAM-dependent methyltransferase